MSVSTKIGLQKRIKKGFLLIKLKRSAGVPPGKLDFRGSNDVVGPLSSLLAFFCDDNDKQQQLQLTSWEDQSPWKRRLFLQGQESPQDYLRFRHQLQSLSVPTITFRFDNLLKGFTELTDTYDAHSYGLLPQKDTDEIKSREETHGT